MGFGGLGLGGRWLLAGASVLDSIFWSMSPTRRLGFIQVVREARRREAKSKGDNLTSRCDYVICIVLSCNLQRGMSSKRPTSSHLAVVELIYLPKVS